MDIRWKAALLGGIFVMVWGLYLIPNVMAPYVDANPQLTPIQSFLIYQSGVFASLLVLIFILLGGEEKFTALRASAAIWMFYQFIDYYIPPYLVTSSGISATVAGGKGSIDVAVASLWQMAFPGITNGALYTLTYVVTPFLFLVGAASLLKPKELKDALQEVF